jgi:PAS domain-containing protein
MVTLSETVGDLTIDMPLDGHVRVHAERLLDMLPIAGYVCDNTGRIIRYNDAAGRLWGLASRLLDQTQRFCGSYRLYRPDGAPLAHADCPMAASLRTGDPVRNQISSSSAPTGRGHAL